MAVRFDASGEGYSTNIALGAQSQMTVSCWIKISVDRNAISTFWQVDSGTDADYATAGTTPDGADAWAGVESGGGMTSTPLTVGTWYFVGVSVNGAAGTMITRSLSATTSTLKTWTGGSASTNAAWLRLGVNASPGSFWFNGCITAVKVWVGRAFTQAQLENEVWSYLPSDPTGLTAWYPLIVPEITDYSGNGRSLTGGTGVTKEDGPGIGWGWRRSGLYIPAVIAVTHALAATGLSTTTDSSVLRVVQPLVSAGLSTDSGSAAIQVRAGLVAAGLSTEASTAALTAKHALTASGISTDAGQASILSKHAFVGSGVSTSASSATLTLRIVLNFTAGLDTAVAESELGLDIPVAATGTSVDFSNAVLYIALPFSTGPRETRGQDAGGLATGDAGVTFASGVSGTISMTGADGRRRVGGTQSGVTGG